MDLPNTGETCCLCPRFRTETSKTNCALSGKKIIRRGNLTGLSTFCGLVWRGPGVLKRSISSPAVHPIRRLGRTNHSRFRCVCDFRVRDANQSPLVRGRVAQPPGTRNEDEPDRKSVV